MTHSWKALASGIQLKKSILNRPFLLTQISPRLGSTALMLGLPALDFFRVSRWL